MDMGLRYYWSKKKGHAWWIVILICIFILAILSFSIRADDKKTDIPVELSGLLLNPYSEMTIEQMEKGKAIADEYIINLKKAKKHMMNLQVFEDKELNP